MKRIGRKALSKEASTKPVEEWYRSRGLSWRLIHVEGETVTVDEAAMQLGVEKSKIIKTLIVMACNKPYAVIVPGDKRLDYKKLEKLLGCKARLASPQEVHEATGYSVGGVPPIALPSHVKLVMDEALLDMDRVYGGGGRSGVLLEFSPRELAAHAKPIIASVSS